jgi:subfamily B ATP-binding cassette protein HlyB/CyaB
LALEPRSLLRWRRHTEEAASKCLSLDHTAAGARSVVTSLERGMSVGIGALGALFVLSDQMTVGALVAFNMLGLRLVQPLIHASSLMQDYQRSVPRAIPRTPISGNFTTKSTPRNSRPILAIRLI